MISYIHKLSEFVFPNRAAAKPPQLTAPQLHALFRPFIAHLYTSPPYRKNAWKLVSLAVLPQYQSRGHGRKLVAWGLEQARKDGVVAHVMAAKGKETFYQRCGFTDVVGWATDGEGNPLKEMGIEGGAILFTPPVLSRDAATTRRIATPNTGEGLQ